MTGAAVKRIGELAHPEHEQRKFWAAIRKACKNGHLHHDGDGEEARFNFETWDAILALARSQGIAAINPAGGFAGPFGYPLLRRWRWLKDARERGLTPREAEREFSGTIDRERQAAEEKRILDDLDRSQAIARGQKRQYRGEKPL